MRLVVMGDFHYSQLEQGSEEMKAARDRAYAIMMDAFLETDGDFHISLGDLTHEGYPEEFQYICNRVRDSGRRFIHVLGNHDTYSIPKADILAITGQQRYSAIDTEEALLLFLDSTKEMNKSDWGGEMDAEQLQWLQEQLGQSGEKPVFVFAHHPVYGTTARSTMEKLSIHPDFDMNKALGVKQGGAFYFCGHNHENSIVRQDGWHFIQTAACLDIHAFRIVEMKDGVVSIGLVAIDQPELTEHIACFNTKMPGFGPHPDPHGKEPDWNLQVNLRS